MVSQLFWKMLQIVNDFATTLSISIISEKIYMTKILARK